jgi:tape measure domain-containing protein
MSNLSEIQLKIVAGIDGLVEIGKLINELDALGGQTTESSAEVEKLVSTLDNLRQQDQLISEFQTLKKGTADLSSTLDEARTRATSLGKGLADSKQQVASTNAEYRSSKAATQALADEWQAAKVKVDLLTKGIKDSASPTRAQRDELKAAKEQAKLLGEQYKASSKETSTLEKAMRSTEQAVKQQTREFNAARKEVNQLDDQYIKQSGTLNGLRTQLQQSGLNTKQLAAEQRSLKAATSQVEQQVGQLANSLRDQAGNQQWLNQQLNTGEKELKQFDSAARQAKGSTKALGDEASASATSFSGWAKGVMASVVALLSIDRAKDAIVELVATSADMDIMEKNAQRAGLEFSELSKFAEDTSLQLTEVMDVAIKTKNYGLDPMAGALQAATDAAAASGKGYEQVDGILTALGQAYTKTKLQQEEMNQLAERGIPAWTLLAEATGKSIPELQGLATAGKLGRAEIDLLIKAIGTEFAGAAKSAMDNTRGLASNIGDEFTKAKDEVASSGLMQYVNEQMREVLAYVSKLRQDGTLKEWGRELSEAMRAVGDYTRLAVSAIQTMAPAIKLMAEAWIGLKIAKWISDLSALKLNFSALSVEAYKSAGGITKSALASEMAIASFGKLGPAVRASTTLIGSLKAGLTGLAASWGIGQILEAIDAYRQMKAAQDAAAVSTAAAAQSTIYAQERFRLLSDQLGVTVRNMDELDALVEQNKVHFDQATQSWMSGPDPLSKTAQAAALAGKSLADYTAEVDAAAKATTSMADSSLADVFAKVQLDLDQISGGVGKTVSEFVSGLDTMTKATHVNAQAIEGYLTKAFDSAKNQAEIQAVIDKMTLLHEQGKLVGAPYVESLAQAAEAAKKLSKESTDGAAIYIDLLKKQKEAAKDAYAAGKISSEEYQQTVGQLNKELEKTNKQQKENRKSSNDLSQAYNELGLQSSSTLADIAADHKKAFDEIRRSTTTVEVQRQAFLAYAEAELKAAQAADRYADGSLYAQAASLGLTNELTALEKTIKTTGSTALITAGALDSISDSAKSAGDSAAEANKELSEIEQTQQKVSDGAQSASAHINDYSSALQQMARDMSAQTEQVMGNLMGWSRGTAQTSSAVADLNMKLEENQAQWNAIDSVIPLDDIQEYIKDLGLAYLQSERAWLRQARSAEVMTEKLGDVDTVTLKSVKQAERLYKSLDMLDEQDLSGLRSAIDSAKAKMDSLESSAKSTLNSLRDELDQYNGALDAIEQRDYETKLASLQAQLVAAKTAQDMQAISDTKESMDLLKELHKKKMQDIADEAAAKKAAAAEEAASVSKSKSSTQTTASTGSGSSSTSSASNTQSTAVSRTIELKLGQSSAKVQVTQEQEQNLDKLLDQLAAAKGITL